MIGSSRRDLSLPVGEVLVSVLRRAVASVIDLAMIGLPLLLGAVEMLHGGDRLTASASRWLAVEAAAMTIAYHGIGVAWTGRTIGKAVMQCRVVRSDTGGRVPVCAALIRGVVLAIAMARPAWALPALAVIYGWALLDPRQQGLHDRAAGTIVVLD